MIRFNSFFVFAELQTALYELCSNVIQGNLKLDLVTSVLGDMMVDILLFGFWYIMPNNVRGKNSPIEPGVAF